MSSFIMDETDSICKDKDKNTLNHYVYSTSSYFRRISTVISLWSCIEIPLNNECQSCVWTSNIDTRTSSFHFVTLQFTLLNVLLTLPVPLKRRNSTGEAVHSPISQTDFFSATVERQWWSQFLWNNLLFHASVMV